MSGSDWLTIIVTIIAVGAGAYMATWKQKNARLGGIALIIVGCISLAAWFGHYLVPATAQQPPSINGNCNAIGNSNSNCTTNNYGPQKLAFGPALTSWLLANVSKDKPLSVEGIGSDSDFNVAVEVFNFLQQNGYSVTLNRTGVRSPPPSHHLMWDPTTRNLIIAPSAM